MKLHNNQFTLEFINKLNWNIKKIKADLKVNIIHFNVQIRASKKIIEDGLNQKNQITIASIFVIKLIL